MTHEPLPTLPVPDVDAGLLRRLGRSDAWAAVGMALLTVALYARAVTFDFVNYDDYVYSADQYHVLSGFTLANLRWAFTTYTNGNWHPLTWLSLMLDAQLFGPSAAGFHASNVLQHAVTTALVFLLLRRLGGLTWASALAAAAFGWHPLRVESVVWITERKDTLSVLFFVLTLHAYLSYGRSGSLKAYTAVVLLLTASLSSKAMAVTAPGVMILLDYWPLRRLMQEHWKRAIVDKIIPTFLCIVFSYVAIVAQQSNHALTEFDYTPFDTRVATAISSYVTYLTQWIAPTRLGVFYPLPAFTDTSPLAAAVTVPKLILLATISAGAYLCRRAAPHVWIGWLFYLGTLVPVIGVLQVGLQGHADRYTYLPHIGLIIALGIELSNRGGTFRRIVGPSLRMSVVALVCVWTVLCVRQAEFWKNNDTLMTHTDQVVPNSYTVKALLAAQRVRQNRTDEAERLILDAHNIAPADAYVWAVLSMVWEQKHEYPRALKAARWAIRYGRGSVDFWVQYGRVANAMGDTETSIKVLRKAVELEPDNAHLKGSLASRLAEHGQMDEAIKIWTTIIASRPEIASVRLGLGLALVMEGATDAGVSELERAMHLDPSTPEAPMRLAWIRATHSDPAWRDGPEALRLAKIALQRADKIDSELLDILAAAYARNADWPAAIDAETQAIATAVSDKQIRFADSMRQRLNLYEQSKPFPPVDRPVTIPSTSSTTNVSDGR